MKRLFILIFLAVIISGCISSSLTLKQTSFCHNVKEKIADDFGVYGLFLQEGETSSLHYCEYFIGKTRVLQLLYSQESDPERAYFESLNGIKSRIPENYYVFKSNENHDAKIKSFYVELLNRQTLATKVYAAAFGDSASITVSAVYESGYLNPFTNGKMLEKIARDALELSQKYQ